METVIEGPSRRSFLAALSAGLGTAGWVLQKQALGAPSGGKRPLCIFSKHLQWLDYPDMAELAAETGFDGVDLTVRPGGHVNPERVETDLPAACKAVRAAGLVVPTITTAINDPDDPLTERVLATAAEQGVGFYRMGYFRYREDTPIDGTLSEARRKLAGIARLNEKHGIVGDYQNHAGRNYFGASLWDLWWVLNEVDSRWLGCQFDLRHAAVEGGMNWPVDFRRIADRVHTLVAKDFRWKVDDEKTEVVNVPLGEGIADFREFLQLVAEARIEGPFSLHLEYPLGGANEGARELTVPRSEVEEAMRRDLGKLRSWLQTSG